MPSGTRPVSFRLDEQYLERLKKEAARYGISAGDYARRIVLDTLEDTERHKTQDELRELKRQIAELRNDVATAVMALLVGAGKVDMDEARAWVSANLKVR
jgi:hypothetical protein